MRGLTSAEILAAQLLAFRLAQGAEVERNELAAAVRTLTALLAKQHPGKTLELRIPPFAAVQLGSATRGAHTRGTPPNVIETDPTTFLAIACGTLSWENASATHLLRASGPHTDISDWFPVVSH